MDNKGGLSPETPDRILFTTSVLLYPAVGGPALRIENSIKALGRITELHVISRVPYRESGGRQAVAFYQRLCGRFLFAPGKGYFGSLLLSLSKVRWRTSHRAALLIFNAPFKALEVILRIVKPCDEADFLVDYARRHLIQTIWFGYGNISYGLIKDVRRLAPDLRLICDTDSVWSRFILRELSLQTEEEKRRRIEEEGRSKEKEEQEWVNLCDITTAVSEVDAAYYRALATDPGRIQLFSNVVDIETYRDVPTDPAGFKAPCVYLAGSFWPNSPMEHAARWVLREVLPLLWRQCPDLHFYILGNGSDVVLSDLRDDRVTVTGRVESVLPYLHYADVVLVPLWFESGTRFKILEAGACRKAVVSTTLGAEGIPVTDGHDILLADTPQDFAEAITNVLQDRSLANYLGQNLFELVSGNFSITSLSQEGTHILDSLKIPHQDQGQQKLIRYA